MDTLARKELRGILLPGLRKDGQVAAVDHLKPLVAACPHESPEMRVEFGRTARDVECLDHAAPGHERDHARDGFRAHDLGPERPGIDVAVVTGLIAAFADIDLKCCGHPALEREPVGFEDCGKSRAGGFEYGTHDGGECWSTLSV